MKTKKEKEEPKVVEVKKDSGIVYSGGASIKIVKNGKVIKTVNQHNSGNGPLFEFLARCLAGNYFPNDRPTCLRVGNYTVGADPEYDELSLTYVNATTSTTSYSGGTYYANISFSFPATLIKYNEVTSEKKLNCLRISSLNNNAGDGWENYSAQLIFDGIANLTADMSLLVVWSMSIATQV